MKELSLNILDIAQNSITAGASAVTVEVTDSQGADAVEIVISDDGCGMEEDFLRRVTDPFTTSRTTRKVGLGVPLFKLAAEMAGGDFDIRSAPGKGTVVTARFQRSHIDRPPLGDLTGTVIAIVQGNPDLNLVFRHSTDAGSYEFSAALIREELGGIPLDEPEILTWISEWLTENEAGLY
ncbi:MAG: ATP-binding protein [Oscillospiraceae bacterium]|jgi:anti-sigma regulatory factor (Ser/Thr protein kinase)|nr:ATP-binding protein [Oscillospiraceae bacterium]